MQITAEKLIAAPRKHVFAVVTDILRWPEFISGIARIELLTPEPVGQGTSFRETRRMLGREASEVMTISELVFPERFVLTAENHGTRYRAEHFLSAEGADTRLRLEFEGQPVSLAARLLQPLAYFLSGPLTRQLMRDLNDLAVRAEIKT